MALDRRQFVAGAALGATMFALSPVALNAAKGRRPNVVFIMADDLGYADLSCTGSHHIRTPAIDSIARNGLFLRQGYSNSSICSPTRTALLTGCYQYRFRVGLEEPQAFTSFGVPAGQPTLASVFRKLGYRTKLVGKWHLGSPPDHGPLQHGYDKFFGIVEGAGDYFKHAAVLGGKEMGEGLVEGNDPVKREGYLTDLFGDESVAWVDSVGNTAPFFLSLHFNAPHWPWEGPEDSAVSQGIRDITHRDGGSLSTYRAMVESMDANVGKLLAALEKNGLTENTIVVFTSDNGGERFSETWPFIGVKGELLEGGIRVPLLVQFPRLIASGEKSEQVMISMDFLPTLFSLAGGDPAQAGTFDGLDLSAQFAGAKPVERTLFWRSKASQQAAVRSGDWKYLKIAGEEFLFDLAVDERERANLIEANPEKAAELRAAYNAWNAQMLPYPLESYSEDVTSAYVDRH